MRYLSFLFSLLFCASFFACSEKPEIFDESDTKENYTLVEDSLTGREVVFRIANGAEISTLDPVKSSDNAPSLRIFQSLFEGLLYTDPVSADPSLGLAREMPTISEDGLVYTFKLRDSLKWSDGHPLTAQDFVYGYTRLLDPDTGSRFAALLYPIEGARDFHKGNGTRDAVQVKALDDQTLVIKLATPTVYFLSAMGHYTFFPYPRHVIQKYGNNWSMVENHVGNGAFRIKKWVKNSHIELEKNPYYYNSDAVKIDRVIFYSTDDYKLAYNMFKDGRVDWNIGAFPPSKIEEVFDRIDAHTDQVYANIFYIFNMQKEPFTDLRVRKAFSLALDTNDLINNVLRNGSRATGTLVPSIRGFGYIPVIKEKREKFDPKQARKLLVAAGYDITNKFPLISLSYNAGDTFRVVAEWMQKQWKKHLRINVVLDDKKWSDFLKHRQSSNFDVARSSQHADFKDPMTFFELFISTESMNDGKYVNHVYDSLIKQSAKMEQGKARFLILKKAEEILLEDYPLIPLYIPAKVHLIDTKKWGGWSPNPLNTHLIRFIFPR